MLIVYTAKSPPIETGGVGSLQNLAGKNRILIHIFKLLFRIYQLYFLLIFYSGHSLPTGE